MVKLTINTIFIYLYIINTIFVYINTIYTKQYLQAAQDASTSTQNDQNVDVTIYLT